LASEEDDPVGLPTVTVRRGCSALGDEARELTERPYAPPLGELLSSEVAQFHTALIASRCSLTWRERAVIRSSSSGRGTAYRPSLVRTRETSCWVTRFIAVWTSASTVASHLSSTTSAL